MNCVEKPAGFESRVCEALGVRWIGDGDQLFSVRVDLIAPDDTSTWVTPVATALKERLPFTNGSDRALVGVDQGRGHEGSPVVGLTFLLRADGFGPAADLAVETARSAAAEAGVTGGVYDVVLVPEQTVVLPEGELSIPMAD